MSSENKSRLENYLDKFTENDWKSAIAELTPLVHGVDRNAVQIWFRFYPLSLHRYLATSPDTVESQRSIALQGDFGLKNRIDTSHSFLYGHGYWPAVKSAIVEAAPSFTGDSASLVDMIRSVTAEAAGRAGTDESLVSGIVAVGLMTLVQVGLEAFKAAPGQNVLPKGNLTKSPDAVLAARAKDDSQGLFGFLKTVNKKFSVIHDERNGVSFEVLSDQELASGSANDRSQDWQAKDPRCWEGPVPVECTSASCGTCWVGVIAGAEKLSPVERRERRAVRVFGYNETDDPNPLIRLACQAKAYGNVTIVIPPWNAVFGKKVYGNVEELELEPVTTSAKALRETVREAIAGEAID